MIHIQKLDGTLHGKYLDWISNASLVTQLLYRQLRFNRWKWDFCSISPEHRILPQTELGITRFGTPFFHISISPYFVVGSMKRPGGDD